MDKFDIRIEGPFEYMSTTGPYTEEELQRHWPEHLINFGPEHMLFLLANGGNLVRMEPGRVEHATLRDWVTLEEWNTNPPVTEEDAVPDMNAASKYFGRLLEPDKETK